MEHGFALGDGTASSASPSGSEELWWRWQTMQWRCRFMRNNVVAPLMKGSKDLGACGLCSTDCALFLRSRIKGRLVALVARQSNR